MQVSLHMCEEQEDGWLVLAEWVVYKFLSCSCVPISSWLEGDRVEPLSIFSWASRVVSISVRVCRKTGREAGGPRRASEAAPCSHGH